MKGLLKLHEALEEKIGRGIPNPSFEDLKHDVGSIEIGKIVKGKILGVKAKLPYSGARGILEFVLSREEIGKLGAQHPETYEMHAKVEKAIDRIAERLGTHAAIALTYKAEEPGGVRVKIILPVSLTGIVERPIKKDMKEIKKIRIRRIGEAYKKMRRERV